MRRFHLQERDLTGQSGDQLHLQPELEMEVEEDKQTDDDPYVDDQIDAAADPDEPRQKGGVLWEPDEIKPPRRSEHGRQPDNRRARVLGPGVEQNNCQQKAEKQLGDRFCLPPKNMIRDKAFPDSPSI